MRIVYRAALAAFAAGAVAACHNDNNRATDSAYGTLPSNGSPQGTALSDSTHGARPANGSNGKPAAATTPAESSRVRDHQ